MPMAATGTAQRAVYLQASGTAAAVDQRERTLLRAIHGFTVSGDRQRAGELVPLTARFEDTVLRRFVIGTLDASDGRLEDGAALLRSAIELGQSTNDATLGGIMAHLAIVELFLLRIDDSNRLARAALTTDTSQWSVDTYGGADPLNILLATYATAGRFDEGLAAADRPPDGGPPPGADRLDGLMGRGTLRLFADDVQGAYDDFVIAADRYRRFGPASLWCMSVLQLARCEYPLGRWDDALAHARLATSVGEDSGLGAILPLAYATSVQVLAARGDWDEAEQRVGDARALGGAGAAIDTAGVAALLARARGDHEGVVANLAGYVMLTKVMPHIPGGAAYSILSAEALIALGRVDEAATALAELADPDSGTSAGRFLIARARGSLAAAQGRNDDADAEFWLALERGVDVNHAMEQPILHHAYGAFLHSVGRNDDARMHLLIALERYERLGANPYASRVNELLAVVGPAVPRPAWGIEALTPQERTVAELVASGMTNREAASQLFVTQKTIEYHLGHIYGKLGVSGRRELARTWNS